MTDSNRILPSEPEVGDKGKLTVEILSAYDLPNDTTDGGMIQPTHVSMTVLGKEVRTGAPSARHRDKNSFKFVSKKDSSKNVGAVSGNEASVTAPLDVLYPETATFKVGFSNHETMTAELDLSAELHVNETKWAILNLEPISGANHSKMKVGENGEHQPTLRLKLCLSGPYRPEIAAIVSMSKSWFHAIDSASLMTSSTVASVTSLFPQRMPSGKILFLPTVPLAAVAVAVAPVILGVLAVGLPFFLPILIALLTIVASSGLLLSGVYFSSSTGRKSASKFLAPLFGTFLATSSGQQLLFETGPRPSPVALSQEVLPTDMLGQLIVSLVIDFIGSSSYLLPGVGETFDVTWAPIQTILLMAMYDKTMPSLKYISFMEEIMPFTDVLPSGTMGWLRCYSPVILEEGLKRVPDNIKSIVVSSINQRDPNSA